MFFKVFLFPINSSLLYLQSIGVAQFYLSFLKHKLLADPIKIVVYLLHNFYFASFDLLAQLVPLLNELIRFIAHIFEVLNDFVPVFLQNVNYNRVR